MTLRTFHECPRALTGHHVTPSPAPYVRHFADKIATSSTAKGTTTIVDRSVVNVSADVTAIRSGKAQKIGDTYVIDGRTYGIHDGTIFPMAGEGFYTFDRGAYKAYGFLNEYGNTAETFKLMKKAQLSDEAI